LSARALLLVIAVLALVTPSSARADGDPASDYLLSQALFDPPDSGVPPAYATQLTAVIQNAKLGGYEIRVALIATRYDLGSVPILFKQPERYARFLGKELYFLYKGRVLVVMPNGLGFAVGGEQNAAGQAVVARIPAPGSSAVAMATGAERAVVRLAAQKGVVVAIPELRGNSRVDNQNRDRLLIVAAVVAALALFGGYALLRRRRVAT
jgi:hypothetical protein